MAGKKTTKKSKQGDNLNKIREAVENKNKSLPEDKQITQAVIAKELGVERETVASWYQNRRHPNLETFNRLADFLKVDVCDLLVRK